MNDKQIVDRLTEMLEPWLMKLAVDQERELLPEDDDDAIDDSYIYDTYRFTSCYEGAEFPGLGVLLFLKDRDT